MEEKPAVGAERKGRQYPKGLLYAALVLAVVSAILHFYIGFAVYGIPLGIPLILIALVYVVGIGMIAMDYRRSLLLRVGLAWVVIVIVLWALSAAVNAPNTRDPLAYLTKVVEVVLLGVLFLLWRRR